jgi:hypothetical protein
MVVIKATDVLSGITTRSDGLRPPPKRFCKNLPIARPLFGALRANNVRKRDPNAVIAKHQQFPYRLRRE